jgi:hypothetical protein
VRLLAGHGSASTAGQEGDVTDPAGSDRLQQDELASGAGTGDDSSLDTGQEDVPLTRDEAIERDSAQDDEQPARVTSDLGLTERADPDGSAATGSSEERP